MIATGGTEARSPKPEDPRMSTVSSGGAGVLKPGFRRQMKRPISIPSANGIERLASPAGLRDVAPGALALRTAGQMLAATPLRRRVRVTARRRKGQDVLRVRAVCEYRQGACNYPIFDIPLAVSVEV